mgnify:CR=1 FL=1
MPAPTFPRRTGLALALAGTLSVTLAACSGGTTATTSSSGATAAAGTAGTIKVGVVAWLGWPIGLGTQRSAEVMAEAVNAKGGLSVGGKKYSIQVVAADDKNNAETSRSAVEKLLQQDKVQFIIGDEFSGGWLSLTEAAKVPVISVNPAPTILDPKYSYSFQGSPLTSQFVEFYGWMAANKPAVKKVVCAFPDNQIGHIEADITDQAAKAFGFSVADKVFYPPDAKDFVAQAARVKAANPDGFIAMGGGPASDSLVTKAVIQSGFTGALLQSAPVPNWFTKAFVSFGDIEGMVSSAYALEASPMSAVAQDYWTAYTAKYPDDPPEPLGANMMSILLAGLQKAGAIDADAFAKAVGSGLTYESPLGPGVMVARPDLQNTRTVDTVVALSIKQYAGGTYKVIHAMTVAEATGYLAKFAAGS